MAHPSTPLAVAAGADVVLTSAQVRDNRLITVTPTGAHRDLTLPAAASMVGHEIVVFNAAASALNVVVKADSATIGTVAQNKGAYFASNGTAWRAVLGA
jgi:hypothetical protein